MLFNNNIFIGVVSVIGACLLAGIILSLLSWLSSSENGKSIIVVAVIGYITFSVGYALFSPSTTDYKDEYNTEQHERIRYGR